MYVECKTDSHISGPAWIGRVTFSQSGKSVYYRGRLFHRMHPCGNKVNYFAADTGEPFWISGCKKAGGDRLYPGVVDIDDDVREEYWSEIRDQPELMRERSIRDAGKYSK